MIECWHAIEPIYSPVSNEVSIGSGSFYENAIASEGNFMPKAISSAEQAAGYSK